MKLMAVNLMEGQRVKGGHTCEHYDVMHKLYEAGFYKGGAKLLPHCWQDTPFVRVGGQPIIKIPGYPGRQQGGGSANMALPFCAGGYQNCFDILLCMDMSCFPSLTVDNLPNLRKYTCALKAPLSDDQ